jgi:hypothetical protein
LPIEAARIYEEHFAPAIGFCLPFVEKPERAGKDDGVEEVRANGDDDIHGARLDEFLPNPRAPVAGFAMTKPARPESLSAL